MTITTVPQHKAPFPVCFVLTVMAPFHTGWQRFHWLELCPPEPDSMHNQLKYNTMTGRSQVREGRMQSLLLYLLLVLLFAAEKFHLLWKQSLLLCLLLVLLLDVVVFLLLWIFSSLGI